MSGRYNIETLADVFTVPEDRLGDFLIDLGEWITLVRQLRSAGIPGVTALDSFVWIDDGKHGITAANLHMPDGSIEVVHL